uniref:Ribosomal RNA processing 1 n=1 Tax=Nannospalax galili TaxID=1026970 RepID=A0A8C6WCM3_NANGA
MAPGVRLPPEIQLAQRLAGNEQVTRDRAVRKLRKYITARTQQAAGGFTHDELLKIWKGLFYCMWMQDKPLLQEELGRTISQLTHAFQTTEAQHLFLRAFWQTMIREWVGIDRLRLDKFYMVRTVPAPEAGDPPAQGLSRGSFGMCLPSQLQKCLSPSWKVSEKVNSTLEHCAGLGTGLTADQNLQFINPFCQIAAHTEDSLVLHSITRNIFETIVEQAPLAIEDLMNELDAQNGEEDVSDGDEESSEGEQEQDSARRRPPAGERSGLSLVPVLAESRGLAGFLGRTGRSRPARARQQDLVSTLLPAKKVTLSSTQPSSAPQADGEQVQDDEDSAGPVLQFDYEAVANRLFELASGQSTPSQNRKRTFPEDDVPEKAYKKLLEGRREPKKKKKKKKRLLKLQPQNERGEAETSSPDPNPGIEKRSRRRPKRAGQRRVPKKRKPLPGARAEGTGKKQPLQDGK